LARVLLAAVAVHLAGIALPVVFVPVFAILAGGGFAGEFAVLISTWTLPVVTLPAAIWVARGGPQETAVLNGLLVGLLVAGLQAVLFFWPNDVRSVALFALIVAAGLAGGLVGGKISSRR
jgi:hypothetical protein